MMAMSICEETSHPGKLNTLRELGRHDHYNQIVGGGCRYATINLD